MKTRTYIIAASAIVIAAAAGESAHATAISPSPTIVSGNITFDNFSCNVTGGDGLACTAISVVPHTSSSPPDATTGDYGIQIQGAFNATPATEDVQIDYDATISGGTFHDASMYFNGTAVSSISEFIYNAADNDLIGTLEVTNPPPDFTDDVTLSENATEIYVVKDIELEYNGETAGTISLVDQNFSQITEVPEPASMGLLGAGLVAFGMFRKRIRKAS